MTFYENFNKICQLRGIAKQVVCRECGLSAGIHSTWKQGKSLPKIDSLLKIAEYLNVSTDYLIKGSDLNIPQEQQLILDNYAQLTSENKVFVSKFIKTVIEMQQNIKPKISGDGIEVVNTTPTITIRHSIYKVSAGKGCDLDDNDQWNTIEVVDTPKSRSADFCLTIEGDSMEPIYHNGDNVLVKSQQAVDIGQIGIFIIEHSGYIKKYGGDRLISLNEKYQDIMFSDYNLDDVRCIGLVIGRM